MAKAAARKQAPVMLTSLRTAGCPQAVLTQRNCHWKAARTLRRSLLGPLLRAKKCSLVTALGIGSAGLAFLPSKQATRAQKQADLLLSKELASP